jgi:hypothetical protein
MDFRVLDQICNEQSIRARTNFGSQMSTKGWHPFSAWVADLGWREGLWMRDNKG